MTVTQSNDHPSTEELRDIRGRMGDSFQARLAWFAGAEDSTRALQTGSLMYTDCGLPSDTLNVVWGAPDSPHDVKMVSAHYALRRFPATWWLPTDIGTPAAWWLAGGGWAITDVLIGLAFKPGDNLKARFEPPEELTVRPCERPGQVKDLGLIQGSVYMKDRPREGGIIYGAYERAAEAVIEGEGGYRAWIGYADGVPVSSIVMIRRGRHFGMYDLATRPEYRGRKYALSTFIHALDEIWSAGCELVTLAAAAKGVELYRALGFFPVTQLVLWTNRGSI